MTEKALVELEGLRDQARNMANALYDIDKYDCSGKGKSCLAKQMELRVSFDQADTSQFCNSCMAYWLAQKLSDVLHRTCCIRRKYQS